MAKITNLEEYAKPGSVLYCKIGFLSLAEHSGIYIGDNLIVEITNRDGKAWIRKAHPRHFLTRLEDERNGNLKEGGKIYITCDKDGNALGSEQVAQRAETAHRSAKSKAKGKEYAWFPVDDSELNCHKFSAGCLLGNFKNDCGSFYKLEEAIGKTYGTFKWTYVEIG
ncbi:AbrB/MazE/SpoVT family DNA-binding domain-containing protein [Helicobacter cynogastricus]|uniref:AbrB/MazE/SpoVT family DNA-binding domain-containing protein n=1 Tax=Helicobacter cynogastricus TaxID=329937 RepID=UPI000CF09B34|nr:AbrB/MazE/SpoVT family DNA-binding domain-containing protein [Helicobacter cynogastricus]